MIIEGQACMQCTDPETQTVGDFIKVDNKTISPIFRDFVELWHWMIEQGWKLNEYRNNKYVPLRVIKHVDN